MNICLKYIVPLLVAISIGNCALSEGILNPSHPNAITSATISKKQSIQFEKVEFPTYPGKVGTRKGGYGNEFPDVKISALPNAETQIKDALTLELQNAGLTVGTGKSDNKINVVIRQYFAEPEVGFFAGEVYGVVDADITIQLKNNKSYKRRFKGMSSVVTLAWTDGFYTDALNQATDNFLTKAVPAIIDLIDGKATVAIGDVK